MLWGLTMNQIDKIRVLDSNESDFDDKFRQISASEMAVNDSVDSIVDEIMFLGPRSYDSVGHKLSLDYIRPLDLYLFLVDIFDQENIEILEGAEDVKADDKELGIIEKTGVS